MSQDTESPQESTKMVNGGLGQNRPSLQPLPPISKTYGDRPNKQKGHPNQDLEFGGDAEIPPLIPDGEYEVIFLRAEKKERLWGGTKVFLHFQIVDSGEYQGQELYMACNVKREGKWGVSSKYFQAWVLAAGRKPDRVDRMSTKVFQGKVFLAKVRTVTKDSKNLPRPLLLQYSIIEDLVQRLTDSEKV